MHFKYTDRELALREDSGKLQHYMICDACYRQVKSDYGFYIEYNYGKGRSVLRHGLCPKCAKKIIPTISNALNQIIDSMDEIRQQKDSRKNFEEFIGYCCSTPICEDKEDVNE